MPAHKNWPDVAISWPTSSLLPEGTEDLTQMLCLDIYLLMDLNKMEEGEEEAACLVEPS